MTRWWMSVALIAGWAAAPAGAQPPTSPTPPGAMPEPTPIAPAPPAGYGPPGPMYGPPCGPGGPTYGGPPPADPFTPPSLPNGFSAFTDEQPANNNWSGCFWDGCGGYLSVGAIGLQRQRMGHGAVVVLDPRPGDRGTRPPVQAIELQSFNDVVPKLDPGVTAKLGYHWDGGAVEATGFYLFPGESFVATQRIGQLDSFFFNAPPGFLGNQGLWLQADRIETRLRTEAWNGEVNVHKWSPAFSGLHALVGFRYFRYRERLQIKTDDDLLFNLTSNLSRVAFYNVRTTSQFLAPQLGFEVNQPLYPWLAFSATAKGAWGINFTQNQLRLERGDGLIGFDTNRWHDIFSHLYDIGTYADVHMGTRFRLRMGYNVMWLLHAPEAVEQVDFNLANRFGKRRDNGNIFLHGPLVELQVMY